MAKRNKTTQSSDTKASKFDPFVMVGLNVHVFGIFGAQLMAGPFAAVITAIRPDGAAHLHVFAPNGPDHDLRNVPFSTSPLIGHWTPIQSSEA